MFWPLYWGIFFAVFNSAQQLRDMSMMDKEFHKNNKKEKLLMNHFGELKCAQC
jgi:hypothetical protein